MKKLIRGRLLSGHNAVPDPEGISEVERQISLESIGQLMTLAKGTTFPKFAVVFLAAAAHVDRAPLWLLIVGAMVMLVGILYQETLARRFLAADVGTGEILGWERRLVYSWLYMGLCWGIVIAGLYQRDAPVQQIFLVTIALALGTGNIIPAHYCLPLFHVYAAPIFISLGGSFIYQAVSLDTPLYGVLAVVMVWVYLAGTGFARILNDSLRDQIRMRLESHTLSEELADKQRESEQATLAMSRFLAAASHDLRQPLHALSLFIDVLRDARSDEERAKLFPRVQLSLEALRKLFDALLDVSRLDANIIKPDYSHFNLQETLQGIAEEFRDEAEKKSLRLRVWAPPVIVVSDRLLLERILRNLIGNAVRYTEQGGVLVGCRIRHESVRVQVWDSGVGIADESIDDIFREFHQLHNPHRDRSQGLGLGLALVRRLCALMQLPLQVRSVPGRGSLFEVSVPRGNSALVESSLGRPASNHWDLKGRHVVVIDDEVEILDAMQTLLEKWGCIITVADSLTDAISALDATDTPPELILSDLRLRDGESGVDVIDALRERYGEHLNGILITGDTEPGLLDRVAATGYEVMQKPVRPAQLRTTMHNALPRV
ncbi:hybrid sensor histidine kinase/response regulator [Alcanivorax sp. S6407]|uniref:ATP-binding response regulator n=1 Tax=Alcanivorax sp. S6407 TaxID=2926424 RepID=UPI001FF693C2|nr:hybrid sensor histidine kinase/response regulator [Alcanivorax sp. S6407]MCK0152875.1 hybrid sensor histidine kinase/response regulator [Alcanivorax sp. S6407]